MIYYIYTSIIFDNFFYKYFEVYLEANHQDIISQQIIFDILRQVFIQDHN